MSLPLTIAALAAACSCAAHAADAPVSGYPTKPVRVIVSLAAGSGADIVTRLVTPKLADAFGRQFVVDNRVGFSGNIGAEIAARSAPDGYTLLVVYAGNAINQSFAKVGYALERDFQPIGAIGSLPLMLVVHASLQVKTVKELVTLARSRPGQLNYASPGNGSLPHLAAELFRTQADIAIVHVPYKSTTQAVSDVAGGQMAVTFAAPSSAHPHVSAGRLRILAVSSAKRTAGAPDVPTIAESGLPGYQVTQWYGLVAPARTPAQIVNRLNQELASATRMPDVREKLVNSGVEPMSSTPADFGAHIKSEVAKWRKAVSASGVRPD
ncbi:MAG TPA: tripartite tricarboxylate transporter substrate binding protein [Burkholderiales bacterium]|nr:tripartite tricarboxylate transporter substrate binding protein [Burkholderiales bacterium]